MRWSCPRATRFLSALAPRPASSSWRRATMPCCRHAILATPRPGVSLFCARWAPKATRPSNSPPSPLLFVALSGADGVERSRQELDRAEAVGDGVGVVDGDQLVGAGVGGELLEVARDLVGEAGGGVGEHFVDGDCLR